MLEPETWEGLADSAATARVEVACGDHGSDEELTVAVRARQGALSVSRTWRRCGAGP